MSQLNRSKLPIAVERHCKLDLPFDHVTTSQFMLLQPVYYRHTLRTEKLSLNVTSVVRPNPIVTPTFGRIRQNLRAFFVPYRLVFPNWEEYINSTIASNYANSGQVVGVPHFDAESLLKLFTLSTYQTTTVVTSGEDFTYQSTKYKFTRLGRRFYKVLYSLGYELLPADKQFNYNALALLAYARIYLDWYANSQYLNNAIVLKLERFMKYNDPTSSLGLIDSDLYDILLFCGPAVYNSNGYFEGAWDNPVGPTNGNFTGFSFTDPTSSQGSYVTTNTNGTPEMYQDTAASTSIGTAYLHEALKKLSEYQRRHALSGARSIDRVLVQYGIQTDYLRQNRSIYVGVQSNDVQISSVFATSNSTNSYGDSYVGDYAGAGFGQGSQAWDFQNDEEGIFIIMQTIQPSGGYYQGYDRNNRLLTRSEFYQAEFDTLGVQAIEKGEVYVSKDFDNFANTARQYAGVFGFTGRYAEKKRSISRVSGDIALPSMLAGGDSWHLMRKFDDAYFNGSYANIVHTEDFSRGTDALSYDRIFTYSDGDYDPFNVFIHVDCGSYAPCHPLTDTFDWDSDSPKVTVDTNGSKLN